MDENLNGFWLFFVVVIVVLVFSEIFACSSPFSLVLLHKTETGISLFLSHKSTIKMHTESLLILMNSFLALHRHAHLSWDASMDNHNWFYLYQAFLSMGTSPTCIWHRNKWDCLQIRAIISGFLTTAMWISRNTANL